MSGRNKTKLTDSARPPSLCAGSIDIVAITIIDSLHLPLILLFA